MVCFEYRLTKMPIAFRVQLDSKVHFILAINGGASGSVTTPVTHGISIDPTH